MSNKQYIALMLSGFLGWLTIYFLGIISDRDIAICFGCFIANTVVYCMSNEYKEIEEDNTNPADS